MSLLEHPTAQALLADAEVSAGDVRGCRRRLEGFLHRYLPRFYREEQRELAQVVLQGKLSNLERKTSEPIPFPRGPRTQAGAALRRRRLLGRRSRHGGTASARGRDAGRPGRRP